MSISEKKFEEWRKEQIASLVRMGYPDAAKAFRDLGSVQWAGWQAAWNEQKAENESLRKDAERYRWLRDGAGYCDTRDIPGMAPARMDAFIDAALGQGEQS